MTSDCPKIVQTIREAVKIAAATPQRPDVDEARIGVVGLSLGGHIVLNAIHLDPERFTALWLDGVQA